MAALDETRLGYAAQGIPRPPELADLNNAIGTLEDAIQKIDQQKRAACCKARSTK